MRPQVYNTASVVVTLTTRRVLLIIIYFRCDVESSYCSSVSECPFRAHLLLLLTFLLNLQSTDCLHVHFGAGKLGLGLVVPALEKSQTRYVILQRPSRDWHALAESGASRVPLRINGEDVVPAGLCLITQAEIGVAAERGSSIVDLVAASPEGQGHVVLTSDQAVWSELAGRASSFSCTLGGAIGKVLEPLLSKLPLRRKGFRPTLYACENDLDSVECLAEQLKKRVDVIPCMVDRICSGRTVIGGDLPSIDVEAEEHTGSIVLLEKSAQSQDEIPLDGETVQVPDNNEIAEYLFIQKKRLVNSMHTVLAFSTLVEYDANNTSLFHWDIALPHLPLLNYEKADPAMKDLVWAWAVAQILVLMKEMGVDLMTEAHSADTDDELAEQMLGVARQTLERFSSVEDTTTRVLGGGVSNRYKTRLIPVQQGMHLVEAMLKDLPADSAQRKVLAAAGVDVGTVVAACDKLVEDAEKFARLDEEKRSMDAEWRQLTDTLTSRLLELRKSLPGLLGKAGFFTGAE